MASTRTTQSARPPFTRQNSFPGIASGSLSIFPGSIPLTQPSSIQYTDYAHKPPNNSSSHLGNNRSPKQSDLKSTNVYSKPNKPSKLFFSLPRNVYPQSSPELLKDSLGVGLYLMSRNTTQKKQSAVQQLGVSPAKFLSLPRPIRTVKPVEPKSFVSHSLPRLIGKEPIKAKLLSKDFDSEKNIRKPADGKEDPNPKVEWNTYKNSSRSYSHSNDPKYHPRSRTVVKSDVLPYNYGSSTYYYRQPPQTYYRPSGYCYPAAFNTLPIRPQYYNPPSSRYRSNIPPNTYLCYQSYNLEAPRPTSFSQS